MKKTKIICSIGPASCQVDVMEKMVLAGMNVARINFTHATTEERLQVISTVNAVREKTGRNDLVINNKKISGNAYYKSKNTYLHHGTILISMDYNHLGKILTPNISKLSKNSVKSSDAGMERWF